MKTLSALLSMGIAFLFLSCGGYNSASDRKADTNYAPEQAEAKMAATADSAAVTASSSAAEVNPQDTHKFVRTADLKFKVKNVYNATQTIENITKQMNGFVTYTNLNSNIDNQTTLKISADSSLVTTYYTMVNDITLRVPDVELDTALKSIATLIDFLNYRTIKADDVTLQLLINKMEKNRASRSAQRIAGAIDRRGKKLPETTDAEELLSDKEEQSDNATLSNLSLQDQINYSTVNISIYQRQTVKREVIPNDKNIDEYTPGLGRQLLDALKTGWLILKAIIVFLVNIWALILLIAAGIFLWYKRKKSKIK